MRKPGWRTAARFHALRTVRRIEILISPALGAATYLGVLLTSRLAVVAQLIVLLMAGIFVAICAVISGLLSWDLLTH